MSGPFYANQNDTTILKIILQYPNCLKRLLRKGDILVLDRGFRDAEAEGYKVLMPALKGKRPRLTCEEANYLRTVKKIRWVVEAIHGIIKQKYKLLYHEINNSALQNIGSICRIACFLNNKFGKRLISDKDNSEEIIKIMKAKNGMENTLALEVETNHWNRKRKIFHSINSNAILDFPELTIQELKLLFTGSYQLSQALCYLGEMINDKDKILASYLFIQNCSYKKNIVRFDVQSRHKSKKIYKCYIDYKPDVNSINGINRYSCDCANGLRTVGCCCHIAAIIYYLSYARYQSNIIRPAELLTHIFDVEEMENIIPIVSDSEESDTEE